MLNMLAGTSSPSWLSSTIDMAHRRSGKPSTPDGFSLALFVSFVDAHLGPERRVHDLLLGDHLNVPLDLQLEMSRWFTRRIDAAPAALTVESGMVSGD